VVEGFGSQLIRDLTAHHGGSVTYLGAPPGCRVQVTMPAGPGRT
jgi:two-component sensor histidine kinase